VNGLLGILNISGYNFLVVVTQKEFAAKLGWSSIYRIKQNELIPFNEDYNVLYSLNPYIEGINRLLNSGFYFSYHENITQNQLRLAQKGDLNH